MTYSFRDPFAGQINAQGDTLAEAIATAYQDIPPEERPAYVWHQGQRHPVPQGQCTPVQ